MEIRELLVTYLDNKRIDCAIAALSIDISRSQAAKLIEEGHVVLNGVKVKKREMVHCGDTIRIEIPHLPATTLLPEKMIFSILYEDDVLFVIDKPPNLIVHPACGHPDGTFANGFLAHCQEIECLDPLRPGIIHRLDKDTSGVLLAAKTQEAVRCLSSQFQAREVEKWYEAILVGEMKKDTSIRAAIGRSTKDRKKMACIETGKEAISHFVPLCAQDGLTYAKIRIETGRTHQIRVHAATLGFPVLGDDVYGRKALNQEKNAFRQMLHCSVIRVRHPITRKPLEFCAPLPQDMKAYFSKWN